MALIEANVNIAPGIFMLRLTGVEKALPGQFFELCPPDGSMLLPRPISVYDANEGEATLVYRVTGRGTKLLSTLKGGELRAIGPLGRGYTLKPGAAVLIGGGLGIAPLRLLAKSLRESEPMRDITVYLGYTGEAFLARGFEPYARVVINIGGYVTDDVDFDANATFYACGPEPMMRAAAKRAREHDRPLYVSLERRMACGVGACYACSVNTASGNRRVCKDGPVFDAREVYFI